MQHDGDHLATPETEGRPRKKPPTAAGRALLWRVCVPVAFALAGLLAATSMINARGTDLRGGRHTDVISLVSEQRSKVQDLRAQIRSQQSEVDALTKEVGGTTTDVVRRQLATLQVPAGLSPLTGDGLAVVLDDAPRDQAVPTGTDPNLLVVHQQDIQAVVNALWAGGATGVSLQGQRLVSTTGIKCVGNTVVLQGVPYSPPYRILAVGDSARMYDALVASPEVQAYRDYTAAPYNLAWSVRPSASLTVPRYAGALALEFARPSDSPQPD